MNSKSKYITVVKSRRIQIFSGGCKSTREANSCVDISGISGHRRCNGDITSFSLESRRRLREFLLTMDYPNANRFGVTVTLPSNKCWEFVSSSDFVGPVRPLTFGEQVQPFSATIHRFGKYLQRSLPGCAMVWRAELQKRGAPHLHCVLWVPNGSEYFDCMGIDFDTLAPSNRRAARRWACLPLHGIVTDCWCRAVAQTCFIGSEDDFQPFFEGFGVDVEPLLSAPRYMRYLCDHMSKHKQEQLGYRGRQWGVVGRRHFERVASYEFRDLRSCTLAARILGKIRRTRIPVEPGRSCDLASRFGYRLSHYHPADSGITIAGSDTMRRLRDYIQSKSSTQSPQCTERPKGKFEGTENFKEAGLDMTLEKRLSNSLLCDSPLLARIERRSGRTADCLREGASTARRAAHTLD